MEPGPSVSTSDNLLASLSMGTSAVGSHRGDVRSGPYVGKGDVRSGPFHGKVEAWASQRHVPACIRLSAFGAPWSAFGPLWSALVSSPAGSWARVSQTKHPP